MDLALDDTLGRVKNKPVGTRKNSIKITRMSVSLKIIQGASVGRQFEIGEGETLIGRWDPDSGSFPEVNLDGEDMEAKVSRKHAIILRSGPELSIRDLGSLNGTAINSKAIGSSTVALNDGDELMIGKVVLKLSLTNS